ncbi:MAG: hypothetical protein E7396_09425 [Ruminococcaceae bacterium]|nr:hypothetical protein [Oscillospiraceae bacterium]
MISVLDKHLLGDGVETVEERVLYDLIHKLMVQAECAHIYGDNENAFKLYASIKAILILFEACELTVDVGYWEWVDLFYKDLLPNM